MRILARLSAVLKYPLAVGEAIASWLPVAFLISPPQALAGI